MALMCRLCNVLLSVFGLVLLSVLLFVLYKSLVFMNTCMCSHQVNGRPRPVDKLSLGNLTSLSVGLDGGMLAWRGVSLRPLRSVLTRK